MWRRFIIITKGHENRRWGCVCVCLCVCLCVCVCDKGEIGTARKTIGTHSKYQYHTFATHSIRVGEDAAYKGEFCYLEQTVAIVTSVCMCVGGVCLYVHE